MGLSIPESIEINLTPDQVIDKALESEGMTQDFIRGLVAGDDVIKLYEYTTDVDLLYKVNIGDSANAISRRYAFHAIPREVIEQYIKVATDEEKANLIKKFPYNKTPSESDINKKEMQKIADSYPIIWKLYKFEDDFIDSGSKIGSDEWKKLNRQKKFAVSVKVEDIERELSSNAYHSIDFLEGYFGREKHSKSILELLKARPELEQDQMLKAALLNVKENAEGSFTKEYKELLDQIMAREQAREVDRLMKEGALAKERTITYNDGENVLIEHIPTTQLRGGAANVSIASGAIYKNLSDKEHPIKWDWVNGGKSRHLTDEEIKNLPEIIANMKKESVNANHLYDTQLQKTVCFTEIVVPHGALNKLNIKNDAASNGQTVGH